VECYFWKGGGREGGREGGKEGGRTWKIVPGTQCSSAKTAAEAAVRFRPMEHAVMERRAQWIEGSV